MHTRDVRVHIVPVTPNDPHNVRANDNDRRMRGGRTICTSCSETDSVPCTFRMCHVERSRSWNRDIHVGQTVNAATQACVDELRVEKFANLLHPARIVNKAEKRADVDPYVERKHGGATREDGTLPSGKRSHCNLWYASRVGTNGLETRDPKRIKKVIGYQHTTTLTTHVGEPPVMEAWEPSSIPPKTASQWRPLAPPPTHRATLQEALETSSASPQPSPFSSQ